MYEKSLWLLKSISLTPKQILKPWFAHIKVLLHFYLYVSFAPDFNPRSMCISKQMPLDTLVLCHSWTFMSAMSSASFHTSLRKSRFLRPCQTVCAHLVVHTELLNQREPRCSNLQCDWAHTFTWIRSKAFWQVVTVCLRWKKDPALARTVVSSRLITPCTSQNFFSQRPALKRLWQW